MPAPEPGRPLEHPHRLAQARHILFQARQSFEPLLPRSGGDCVQSYYRIGNTVIRVIYREPLFETKLLPALSHLKISDPASSSATIFLAGSDVLGEGWSDGLKPESSDPMAAEGFFESSEDTEAALFVSNSFASVSCLDKKTKTALYGITDFQNLPAYEIAAPLRVLLYWILSLEEKQAVHAACVGTLKGAVLIAGRGGSGKSNTALACLASGLLFAGDDYAIVHPSEEPPRASSFYASTKLFLKDMARHESFERFFSVQGAAVDSEEKMAAVMTPEGRSRILHEAPVKAVLIPVIEDRAESSLEPLDRAGALKELAPSTLFQFPGAGQADFQRMAKLVRKVPCYRLRLGRDPLSFSALIRALCESSGRAL